jgi:hypothetical protein
MVDIINKQLSQLKKKSIISWNLKVLQCFAILIVQFNLATMFFGILFYSDNGAEIIVNQTTVLMVILPTNNGTAASDKCS